MGYFVPIINAGNNYLKQCDMVQTEGLIFIYLLSPGVFIYVVMKVIEVVKENTKDRLKQ